MRTASYSLLIVLVSVCSGCSLPDVVFNLLGDNYTGGGMTRFEKKSHYDGQLERFEEEQR